MLEFFTRIQTKKRLVIFVTVYSPTYKIGRFLTVFQNLSQQLNQNIESCDSDKKELHFEWRIYVQLSTFHILFEPMPFLKSSYINSTIKFVIENRIILFITKRRGRYFIATFSEHIRQKIQD